MPECVRGLGREAVPVRKCAAAAHRVYRFQSSCKIPTQRSSKLPRRPAVLRASCRSLPTMITSSRENVAASRARGVQGAVASFTRSVSLRARDRRLLLLILLMLVVLFAVAVIPAYCAASQARNHRLGGAQSCRSPVLSGVSRTRGVYPGMSSIRLRIKAVRTKLAHQRVLVVYAQHKDPRDHRAIRAATQSYKRYIDELQCLKRVKSQGQLTLAKPLTPIPSSGSGGGFALGGTCRLLQVHLQNPARIPARKRSIGEACRSPSGAST